MASVSAGVLLSVGVVAPVMAAGEVENGLPVDGVSLAWAVNAESTGGAYFGGCNFLSAGTAGDTGSARLWTESDGFFKAADGNVEIVKPNATGDWEQPTWSTKCQNRYATTVNGRTAGLEMTVGGATPENQPTYTEAQVRLSEGEGWVDPDSESAHIEWDGSFTIAYYGGMTYWSITDPVLTVDNGVGTLTGIASGFGTDMDDMSIWQPLDATEIHLADLADVDVTDTGINVSPQYLGVEIPADIAGRNPQATLSDENAAWWGSFPESWLRFNILTGQDSYWYTTAGGAKSIQPRKIAAPISVSYEVPNTVPDAPGAPTVTAPDFSSVKVEWQAPADNGGTDVTSYTVTLIPSEGEAIVKADLGAAELSTTFDGLLPGVSYTATVQAVNAVGASPASAQSSSVIPNPNPLAGFGFTIQPDTALDPAVDNVLTISGHGYTGGAGEYGVYVVVAEEGSWTPGTVPATRDFPVAVWVKPEQVTNGNFGVDVEIPAEKLSADKSYIVGTFAANRLSMTDRRFDSAQPLAVQTPAAPTVPVAPEAPVVNVDDFSSVNVVWEAPVNNGGTDVTSYTVTLIPSEGEPIVHEELGIEDLTTTFTDLLPGVSYTATVQAVNEVGVSPASAQSSSVIPNPNPEENFGFTVEPNTGLDPTVDNILTVTGQGYTGGAGQYGVYVVVAESSTWQPGQVPATRDFPVAVWVQPDQVIDGSFHIELKVEAEKISADKSYIVGTFAANRLSMTDRRFDYSQPLSIEKPATPTAPEAPVNASAIVDGATVTVSWGIPANDGNSPITGYRVELSPVLAARNGDNAPITIDVPADSTSATFNDVPAGTYVGLVSAVNNVGASAPAQTPQISVASPATVPASVSGVTVVAGEPDELTVSWTASADDGGSPITGYLVTLTPAEGEPLTQEVGSDATSAVFTGLSSDMSYKASVIAVNEVGSSVEASAPNAATPAAKPGPEPAPQPEPKPEPTPTPVDPKGDKDGSATPDSGKKTDEKKASPADKSLAATGTSGLAVGIAALLVLATGGALLPSVKRSRG